MTMSPIYGLLSVHDLPPNSIYVLPFVISAAVSSLALVNGHTLWSFIPYQAFYFVNKWLGLLLFY